ncbi:hypothetical protein GCM10023191_024250 [Actinoallomurus oryzae]|uniref:Uncharacterized protein n=1 Tax=Actinoallomurus oryzae TaxID=502180 RepID=A0ABP8PRA5_9ACTN
MGAVAAGQLLHPLDALLAALGDDIGGAELAAQVRTVLVPPHQDLDDVPAGYQAMADREALKVLIKP